MQSIYEAATLENIISRINKLTPSSKAQWGKMNVSQMMAHCSAPLEIAVGDEEPGSGLIGKILGPMIKARAISSHPFTHSLPTHKSFVVSDSKDFNAEKTKLSILLTRLSNTGRESIHNRRHPLFGNLTAEEWSTLMVKHLDHHLRQFGV